MLEIPSTGVLEVSIGVNPISISQVTPSAWTNPYCFRAYDSGGTTIADGTATKVLFATENFDPNNNFANSSYTAPVTGFYQINGRVAFATSISTGVAAIILIYVDGVEYSRGMADGTSFVSSSAYTVSDIVPCNVGQTIDIYMYQDSAGTEATQTGSAHTYISGHLVHQTIR